MVLLLLPEAHVGESCSQRLQVIWDWLQKAETKACTEASVKKVLDELGWTNWVWVRRSLIMLRGLNFKHVPYDVERSLQAFATGMLSSEMARLPSMSSEPLTAMRPAKSWGVPRLGRPSRGLA